jgi:hypothetical protein
MKTPRNLRIVSFTLASIGLLLIAGCSTTNNLCQLRDPNTGQLVPPTFTGTIGTAQVQKELEGSVTLQSVSTTACDGFDRVIFQYNTPATPGYHVSYLDKPIRQCGSGQTVAVAGDAWLEVRTKQTQAHTDAGQSTIAQTNRTVNLPNLRQLVQTCDFEGHVTWVLGVGSPKRFRVVELTNPSRIVVDIKH